MFYPTKLLKTEHFNVIQEKKPGLVIACTGPRREPEKSKTETIRTKPLSY
jgi:hypothetical protein